MRRLAIFDLDNTLLAGDSDHAWGDFLIARGVVDGRHYKATNDRFYEDYVAGRLDIRAYLEFALQVLAAHPKERLDAWHREFMRDVVEPMILPQAEVLLRRHRDAGDFLLIITATNDFVTRPIGERLGVHDLLATTAELVNGRYTGRVTGTPCYREGKVTRLDAWLRETGHSLTGSVFYSDSHNDIPLLAKVDRAVAVDPDDSLRREAEKRGWEIRSLRE
ncbi:MAG: HAD family hydrolase [Pseudomonadota bacterium]